MSILYQLSYLKDVVLKLCGLNLPKGVKTILHVKSPTFRAAKFKGSTIWALIVDQLRITVEKKQKCRQFLRNTIQLLEKQLLVQKQYNKNIAKTDSCITMFK